VHSALSESKEFQQERKKETTTKPVKKDSPKTKNKDQYKKRYESED